MERAAFAAGHPSTVRFADEDDERMEFVAVASKVFRVAGGSIRSKGLLGQGLNFGVFCVLRRKTVADDDAAQILIDHHDGGAEGVEEDGVGGFGADAEEGEQLAADNGRIVEGGAA